MRHLTGWIVVGSIVVAAACIRTQPEPAPPTGQATPEPMYKLMTHWEPTVSAIAFERYVDDPMEYVGTVVVVEATVHEVISDRAFWVDGDDEGRALVVIRDGATIDGRLALRVGDRIRFHALVLPSSARSAVVGPLDPAVRQAISSLPAFLAVYWADVVVR